MMLAVQREYASGTVTFPVTDRLEATVPLSLMSPKPLANVPGVLIWLLSLSVNLPTTPMRPPLESLPIKANT